jgi:hypothetical protein
MKNSKTKKSPVAKKSTAKKPAGKKPTVKNKSNKEIGIKEVLAQSKKGELDLVLCSSVSSSGKINHYVFCDDDKQPKITEVIGLLNSASFFYNAQVLFGSADQ